MKTQFNINVDEMKKIVEQSREKEINVDWQEMPEWGYNKNSWPQYHIYCITNEDRYALGKALNIDISATTKSIWFKDRPVLGQKNEYWDTEEKCKQTTYPLYIISYNRAERRLTQQAIEIQH